MSDGPPGTLAGRGARGALAGLARAVTIRSMFPGRIARSVVTSVTTSFVVLTSWVLAGPAAAQKPVPATYKELGAPRPWTYLMAWALLGVTVVLIAVAALVYLLKGRDFRANQRRGGSK